MDNRKSFKIVFSEKSEIIAEGFLSILKSHNPVIQIIRLENLAVIEDYCMHHNVDLIVINPSLIINMEKVFTRFRKNNPEISILALTYQLLSEEHEKLFDEAIYITDSYHNIAEKIHRTANTKHCEESHNDDLTDRELDVLKAITKGLSNKEIADHLNISIHTVISHRKNITEKTGIKSISGLTIYAISQKIIPL